MKAAFRLIVGILLLSALLAACAPATAPSEPAAPAEGTAAPAEESSGEPQRGGVLVVGRPADVVLWDPKYTNDNSSLWAQGQVFATLVQNSADGLELRPWLAESWEINENATEYTFYLHDNAEFCNGTPITAEDVKWSIDRAMEDDSAVSWQFPANPVVEVIDDHTLKITLDRPNVAFSNYVTLWGSHVLSKAYAEEVGIEALAENPMGSGPFCVERWDKGQLVVLKPNPGYWVEGQPYVDEVQMRVIADDNARVLQLQTGEIDIALDIPASQFQALEGMDGVEAHIDTLYGTAAIVLNQRTVPEFADVNVRKAMLMALDRQAMIDSILFGQGEVAKSPFYGPAILFWTGDHEVPYDLEGAKALMAESVAPDGFAVELLVPAGDSIASDVGVIVKDQLAQLNIDVTVTPVESGTWWEMWSGGTYQMLYKLGTNDVIDPAENIPFDFWSFEDGGSDAAFTGYYNPELVKLSMDAEAELDVEKRAQLYYELQRIAMDEVPQLWLFHPDNRWATRDNVENFAVFPTKLHRFWEVWKSGE